MAKPVKPAKKRAMTPQEIDEMQSREMKAQLQGLNSSVRSIDAMRPKPPPVKPKSRPVEQPSQMLGLRKGQGMKSRRGMLKGF